MAQTVSETQPAAVVKEPDTISGGHLVARAPRAEGIDVIFTLCGGHIIDIYDGCIDEGIKVLDVRHEQVAAHAADGYARVTGRPGCAVVTAGPGTTDAVTGIANALRAESPMLLIGGQGALDQHRMGSLQDLPHVDMMKPITKFASSVLTTERVADMCSMAFREAMAGAPGPAFLEIGRDILDAHVPLENAVLPEPGHYRASTKSTGDPHHFLLTRPHAFNNADVILIGGTPFEFRMGYGKRLSQDATVVQIDMDYRTVGKNRDVSLGLVGDPGAILTAVADAAEGQGAKGAARDRESWLQTLRDEEQKAKEERLPKLMREDAPVHPLRLAHEINEFLTDNTVYIGDGGDVVTFSGGVVQPRGPGLWMDPGPLGTLGVGVPFAIAAKVARPDREVVCLFGDGAFSLTGWDFETAMRFDLPFIGVVGNNSYMNQIRYGQIQKYGEAKGDVGNKLGDVKYDLFAQMLGGYGEEVREPKDIRPALERARESGKPSLINVWIDQNAFAPGTMNQTMYK